MPDQISDVGVERAIHGYRRHGCPPSAEDRLGFLRLLQRVLNEGEFTATYKFALLQAFLDLAIESHIADDAELFITYRQLAERFVEYYWNHTDPYTMDAGEDTVLFQSSGRQAAVLSQIDEVRRRGHRTLAQFRRLPREYASLLGRIAKTIREQPVRYMQNLNGERVDFLFEVAADGMGIRLLRGVAWCLKEFHDLIQDQLRSRWVEHVRRISSNAQLIGNHRDLEVFLFGQQRAPLARVREVLLEIEGDRCFYCSRQMRNGKLEVDHFVPWSRYPRDRGHNFVLAHAACNNRKRDALAGAPYLSSWIDRLEAKGSDITASLGGSVLCEAESSRKVAAWAYGSEISAGGRFWDARLEGDAQFVRSSDELVAVIGRL